MYSYFNLFNLSYVNYFQNQLIHTRMGLFKVIRKWVKYYERMLQDKENRGNIGTNKDLSTDTLNTIFLLLILYWEVKLFYQNYHMNNEVKNALK